MNPSNNMFKEFDIPIPNIVYFYDDEKQIEICNYLTDLVKDEQQKKAYAIAFNHLGSSFNIYKSNGFKQWKANQK
jgi:hypothetical protein